jgi:hypothetical protein
MAKKTLPPTRAEAATKGGGKPASTKPAASGKPASGKPPTTATGRAIAGLVPTPGKPASGRSIAAGLVPAVTGKPASGKPASLTKRAAEIAAAEADGAAAARDIRAAEPSKAVPLTAEILDRAERSAAAGAARMIAAGTMRGAAAPAAEAAADPAAEAAAEAARAAALRRSRLDEALAAMDDADPAAVKAATARAAASNGTASARAPLHPAADDDEEVPIRSRHEGTRAGHGDEPEPDDADFIGDEPGDEDDDQSEDEPEPPAEGPPPGEVEPTEAPGEDVALQPYGHAAAADGRTLAVLYINALDALNAATADYVEWLTARGIRGTRRWHRVPAHGTVRLFRAGRKGKVIEKGAGSDVEIFD